MSGSGQKGNVVPAAGPGRVALITAIVLIGVYIAMLAILAALRNDKDWDRLVYLLSGFEALVFSGAGALFGTTIQRATVTTARADAADAKQVAQAERVRADQAEKDATAGRALAKVVQTKASIRARGSSGIRGARPAEEPEDGQLGGLSTDLDELAQLASAMLPVNEPR
jgi:hypothetical protein